MLTPGKTADNGAALSNASEIEVALAPNPSSEFVTILLQADAASEQLNNPQVVLFNIAGAEVQRSGLVLDAATTVNVGSLGKGLYIAKIVDGGRVLSTQKLVVE